MVTEDQATYEAEKMTIPTLRRWLHFYSNYGIDEVNEADQSELEGMYIKTRLGLDPFRNHWHGLT